MDALPVLSQVKSLVQVICGQKEQARQTQINFSRQCPVVSQVRSAVEGVSGDKRAARETQKEFGKFMLQVVDGVPVVGHVKGAVHYALRDKVRGDLAMKAASHTTAVIAGGVAGFCVGGPPGAIAAGAASGIAIDSVITGVDSAICGKVKPYGFTEPFADPKNAGKWVDAFGGVVIDGVTGHAAGAVVRAVQIKVRGGTSAASAAAASAGEEGLSTRVLIPKHVFAKIGTLAMTVRSGYIYLSKNKQVVKIAERILANLLETFSNTDKEKEIQLKNADPINAPVTLTIRVKDGVLELMPYNVKVCVERNKICVLGKDGSKKELREGVCYNQEGSESISVNDYEQQVVRFSDLNRRNIEGNDDDDSIEDYEDASELFWEDEEYAADIKQYEATKKKNTNVKQLLRRM